MQIVKLSQNHTELLEKFCKECELAGYNNNSSLSVMKWGDKYDLREPANFWGLIIHDELASISGSHSIDPTQLRCLFRSATLPRYNNLIPGLSKNHMNSIPFSLLLPQQIIYGAEQGYKEFYITTSHTEHDVSGKMNRTHRAISLLSKKGIVDSVSEEVIYHIPQTKWQINVNSYANALESFSPIRQSLNIEYDTDHVSVLRKLVL